MRTCLVLILVLAIGGSAAAESVPAAGLPQFCALAAADTVRTNLWVAQALMAEIVGQTLGALPAAPGAVVLRQVGEGAAGTLFGTVASARLAAQGYDLFLGEAAPEQEETVSAAGLPEGPVWEYRFRIEEISLGYPATGRRAGIWRQWVARRMEVSAFLTIVEVGSGRLLLNDRFQRGYQDRVPSAAFPAVRSSVYAFTDASLQESGWRRRLEEIVVLGTLAGLVAVYFANTGN